MDIDALIKEAGSHLINGHYLEALSKVMTVLATDGQHPVAYQIAEQAAIELGEFELAKNFFLFKPSSSLPAKPRVRGKNPALPPQFKLPPIIGAGNDYRHILEQAEIFKASNQPYTKTVSIIIPVYDRQAVLANTLAALTHQTYPQSLIEIIVVDDGSHDGILDVIRKYETRLKVYYARQEDDGYRPAAARNMGLRLAKGDAIIFMDADILPLPQTVESYMQVLHVSDECVLIGHRRYVDVSTINDDDILADIGVAIDLPDINPDNDVVDEKGGNGISIDWRFPVYTKTAALITDLWSFTKAASGNLAFSHSLVEKSGYVDEAFAAWGCEDIEHGYRLYNAGAYFIPMLDIICLHQEPLDATPTLPTDTESKSFRATGHDITKPILAQKCPAPYVRQYTSGTLFEIPKVSIYIPAYNAARYIVDAVKSCLAQTYDDLEVVICDDGSTDDTLYLLEEHFTGNPRVRWVSQRNGGIGKATNTAIRHCRGMYIGQLDADDLLKPEAVQACVRALDGWNIEAVYTDCDYIDENADYIRDSWCGGYFVREWMATGMIATHFRMFRKRTWSRMTGCNEHIKNAVDLDLWLKINEKGHIGHIHQILYSYRWHGDNTSLVHRKQQENNHLRVVADSFARQGLERFWAIQSANNPLAPREFRVVPVANPTSVTPQDVVFLIPSCTRYAGKKAAIRETWAKELAVFGFRYFFLAGNAELLAPMIEGDTLYVPCHDDYEHLLLKLVLGYQFLYRNMDFSHVYKLDDDCFPNLGRIAAYILPQLAGKQYAGGSLHPKETVMNTTWHYGKCSNPQFEKPYPVDKQPFAFAKGGYGYWLRRDVLPILFEQLEVLKEELERCQYSFEDLRVAEILNHSGITVHALEHYALARNLIRLPNSCTVIYDISEPESFFQINNRISERHENSFKGAVVFVYATGKTDPNGTHFNSVLAYSAGFVRYGYKPYYVKHDEINNLANLLTTLKQTFAHVIVHCEQSHGLSAESTQQDVSLAEALQIPFVAHIRDYTYCPWTQRNLVRLSEQHTLYHTDKRSAEFSQDILGEQAKHRFLPHVYFKNYPANAGSEKPASHRPIKLLYVGSYFNPAQYRDAFNAKHPDDKKLFDHIVDASLYDYQQPIWDIARSICAEQAGEHLLADQETFLELIFNAGFFVRWTRRSQLLRKIARYPVTMVWNGELPPIQLHKGTTLLPPTNMEKTLELMSESKAMLMMLNNFTHSLSERLLSAMHHRCLAICNRNVLIEESFVNGRDMLMYGSRFEGLEEAIDMTLNNRIDIDGMTHNAFQLVNGLYTPFRYAEQVLQDHAMPPFD